MTIAELHANEDLRRAEFPVTREKVYLAHAGVSPLPRRVSAAISDYAGRCSEDDQEALLAASCAGEARVLAARLLSAQPGEVAFVGPTSLALSYVARGLPFRDGDNVLIHFEDYPANVYPWMALSEQGVQVRRLQTRTLGGITPDDVLTQVDGRTRLVALASCHFVSGYRVDHAAIGRRLRERNILFCVDAIQTLGAFPTTVEHVDFLAADAHKWLLGPCAAGVLYVRQSLQDTLRPPVHGWHNVRCPNYIAQEQLVYRPDARRYEAGTQNWLGLVGLRAALELLLEVGVDRVAAELLRQRASLIPALQAKGYTVLHADAPAENAGGIISFYRADTRLAALHERLSAAGVLTSLRADRAGRPYLRLAPHVYNTDAELGRLLELL